MVLKEICLPGTYHTTNGCYQCPALPLLTASLFHAIEMKSCLGTFSIPAPGIQEAYIPVGVSNIKLILLENDSEILGEEGGQFSCTMSVPMNQTVYVVITSTNSNDGNEGLGSISHNIKTSQNDVINRVTLSADRDDGCKIGPYIATTGIHLTGLVHVG